MSNLGDIVDSHSTLVDRLQSTPLCLGFEEFVISPSHMTGFKDKNHQGL